MTEIEAYREFFRRLGNLQDHPDARTPAAIAALLAWGVAHRVNTEALAMCKLCWDHPDARDN